MRPFILHSMFARTRLFPGLLGSGLPAFRISQDLPGLIRTWRPASGYVNGRRGVHSEESDFVRRYWAFKDRQPNVENTLGSVKRPHSPQREPVARLRGVKLHRTALGLDFDNRPNPEHIPLGWLRDSCPCPLCVDPHSGQKNFSTSHLPSQPAVQSAEVEQDGSLKVVWAGDVVTAGQPHVSVWPPNTVSKWLRDAGRASPHKIPSPRIPWDRLTYEKLLSQCVISYDAWLLGEAEFWNAFSMLCRTGLIVVTDVPGSEVSVERVAERIGDLQDTFYGRTWDVRSKPQAENVAYTSQFLGLHQDLMYMADMPKLQFLHCLENTCDGGEALFSDGLRAALELKLSEPEQYEILKYPMLNFHYNKGGYHFFQTRSAINEVSSRVENLAWAPPFQGPFHRDLLQLGPNGDLTALQQGMRPPLEKWKEAAASFEKISSTAENMIEFRYSPGDCVIFDNSRAFHGRRQFNTATGSRWLKGCYVSNQTFQAVMNRAPPEFLQTEPDVESSRVEAARQELEQVSCPS